MSDFKIGDLVERISGDHLGMRIGDVSKVIKLESPVVFSDVRPLHGMQLADFYGVHSPRNFKLWQGDEGCIGRCKDE